MVPHLNLLMQICVWSTGNAARPIVQAISAQIPEQRATMEGRNPATTKLAVDPFLRIDGAMDAIALGDCSRMTGAPLPATAQVRAACSAFVCFSSRQSINPWSGHARADGLLMQVAGQQGAYVARMINRGYIPGRGGLTAPFPCRRVEASSMSSQVCQSQQWLGLMPNCGGLRGHALGFIGRWRIWCLCRTEQLQMRNTSPKTSNFYH